MIKKIKITLIAFMTFGLLFLFNALISHHSEHLALVDDIPNQRPNNGTYKEYYEDGTLKSKELYHQGKKKGVWIYYHPNGNIRSVHEYKNDMLHGTITHYDTGQTLIFNDYYNLGHCYRREIVNDSLYRFEVNLLPHGKELFETSCVSCHDEEKTDLTQPLQSMHQSLDSMDLATISVDSIHFHLFDSLFVDQPKAAFSNEKTAHKLDRYDIRAIIQFIEKQSIKKQLPLNPRKHRIKGKIS